jgi:NAD(P)H dehydrogenase (quinone)
MNSPTPPFTAGTPSSEAKQGAALFLITGATGNTGDTTVRLLLQRGHRVRAFVHRSDARSESLGADGARSLSVIFSTSLQSALECAGSRERISVTRLLPVCSRPSPFSPRQPAKLVSRPWSICPRSPHAVLRLPFGNGRHAPIAGKDQAYVIAAILENPEPHDRQIYPLYGPVEMNHYEIADAISKTLGIPVRYEPLEVATFAEGLKAKGSHLTLSSTSAMLPSTTRTGSSPEPTTSSRSLATGRR